ncbi:hypothetical protein A2U01_0110479, partial [Trifolium medium]|nr:hypothetical protein [Trifolium medium]
DEYLAFNEVAMAITHNSRSTLGSGAKSEVWRWYWLIAELIGSG